MNIFSAFAGSKRGRTMRQRLVRLLGRTLSTIAPEHASRLAAWIWSSPPGRRRGQSTLVEGAKPISLDLDGRTAAGQLWQATGPQLTRVLVQHGWGGSVAQMSGPIRTLVEAGATVVAFDAFGHGATGAGRHGRRQSSLIELSDLVEAVNKELGPFSAVVAHSAATAAVARAMRRTLGVDRAVFLAPLVDPLGQSHVLSDALGLSPGVANAWPEMLLARFGTSRTDIDMMMPPPLEHIPETLIIQDQDDRLSSPEGARRLSRAWPRCHLLETQGLGHYRVQNDPGVLAQLVQFVVGELGRPVRDERVCRERSTDIVA